jgi:hypothetical protein
MMKRIIFNALILLQIIFLFSCASPEIKYEAKKNLNTNLPKVYVKNFQCWDGSPLSGGSTPTVSFTLVNKSNCTVDRNVKIILYDGNDPIDSCNWYPYYTTDDLDPISGLYGESSSFDDCNCQQYKRIEFRAEWAGYCNQN